MLFQWHEPDDASEWSDRIEKLVDNPNRWGCWVGTTTIPAELLSDERFEVRIQGDPALYCEIHARYVGGKKDVAPQPKKAKK